MITLLARSLDARGAQDDFGAGFVRCCFLDESRKGLDVKKVQGFDGERDFGAGHFLGRRGRADLRGVRGRAARVVSGYGDDVRGDAPGRSRASGPAAGDVQAALWRSYSVDPAGECERVFGATAELAGAAAGRQRGAAAG